MRYAYSTIELKAMDDEKREFTGIATTPTPDRMGDIVESQGAQYTLPIPLLWQHDSEQPIGLVTQASVTKSGIAIRGKVLRATESRTLADRLDEAWESIKIGLVRGLSIGFQPLEETRINDTYSFRYLKWSWLELSAVTIPANADASIMNIKSMAQRDQAAFGRFKGAVRLDDRRAGRTKSGAVYLPRK